MHLQVELSPFGTSQEAGRVCGGDTFSTYIQFIDYYGGNEGRDIEVVISNLPLPA